MQIICPNTQRIRYNVVQKPSRKEHHVMDETPRPNSPHTSKTSAQDDHIIGRSHLRERRDVEVKGAHDKLECFIFERGLRA
ncbi:hypothetical protein TSUD_367140 [Trifolium subterraneum]|uniref:Uncharacterized protein n=1 Tax=Trifolium subterraneum TaxID=3900 RepID=A0A2Z6PGV0_TRISU|nr:hypothetical protein TSUD_367140 [Trifolium subterraneum]